MRIRRKSLESRIKFVVTGLAFCLTAALISMSLAIDARDSFSVQRDLILSLATKSPAMTTDQVVSVMEEQGENWRITSDGQSGTRLTTADGVSWHVEVNGNTVFKSVLYKRRHLLVSGLICLLISAEIAVFLAYWITRPLKRLVWGCSRVAGGDLSDLPGEIPGTYEIETLYGAFDRMVRGLRGRRDLERRVSRMERLAALGQVVAGVSHEIKNPLASMRIHLDLLDPAIAGRDRESLDVLGSELDRLNRVVTQLLSFARPSPPLPGPVAPGEILDWCRGVVGVKLSASGVKWRQAVEEGIAIWGDREQLRQLLLNLVLNGLEASSGGGSILVSMAKNGGGTILTVSDEGEGIPAEVRERIFDPFVTSKPDGTGLGLSMSYRIVEMHHGKMDYETSAAGTTFTVWFPDEEGVFREDMDNRRRDRSGRRT